ncbi:MAG: hypothetical protein LBD95_05490 [Clostridiales Family XIII bacterium]|jgi:hypothetical protein|nr:hypothetical protein [Clostridiales Family XIII bacterium]
MLRFIASNASTILISLSLAGAVCAIVGRGVQKLRRGQGFGCSRGCGACGRACDRGNAPSQGGSFPSNR